MCPVNSDSIKSSTTFEINDDILIHFFCKLLEKEKIQYIKEMEKFDIFDEDIDELSDEKEYKDIDNKKLVKILNKITLDDKPKESKIEILKLKKIIFQKLWPHFIRNAIRHLRYKDFRDRGKLKFDFGVKSLMDYFREFSKFEELLYGIDEFYRDHSSHVFRVYLLGEFITRKFIPNNYESITIFDQPSFKNEKISKYLNISNDEKEALWCIIALCHDLGYPLQKIYKLNKKLSKILKYFGIYNFERIRFNLPQEGTILNEYIIKILSSKLVAVSQNEYRFKVQSKFYTKFSNAYEKLAHGILSCILLMKNLVYFKETDFKKIISSESEEDENHHVNAKQYLLRREILRAIASHDCLDIYHIQVYNYPFLLIICDEIQEWSRPFSKRRIFYGWENEKCEKIQINSFTKQDIEIYMKIDLTPKEMEKYVEDKIRKFIRILRSAVNSYKREFKFKIIIENKRKLRFEFIYNSPKEFYKKNDFSFDKPVYYEKPQVIKNDNGVIDNDYLTKIIKL